MLFVASPNGNRKSSVCEEQGVLIVLFFFGLIVFLLSVKFKVFTCAYLVGKPICWIGVH